MNNLDNDCLLLILCLTIEEKLSIIYSNPNEKETLMWFTFSIFIPEIVTTIASAYLVNRLLEVHKR